MINVLIGIFYVALIALVSYLLYYIIKTAVKDAYNEIKFDDITKFENTDFDETKEE